MNPIIQHGRNGWVAVVTTGWLTMAGSAELATLPVHGSLEQPTVLLELGSEPPALINQDQTTQALRGEIAAHEGATSIQTDQDEIAALHPGFGTWNVAFRFPLPPKPHANPYTFWARWRQGGDPDVCVQTFEVWAGPDQARLEQRGLFQLKPRGWDYAWVAAEPQFMLKSDDAVIEIRNRGAGHDAKVFDAFLLGPPPPPPALPARGTAEMPVVLLELGKEPKWLSAAKDPTVQIRIGTSTGHKAAHSVVTEKDEIQVFHKGFGTWDASFQFSLSPSIPPGLYSFFARYQSGGEVSQVPQTFTIKAGTDSKLLATRGSAVLTNTTPWEYQWLKSASTIAVLPGDTLVVIENTGKADGAKIFDAFLLKLETPLGNWMKPSQAASRNRFLALPKSIASADKRLYVLDGEGEKGDVLFDGLAADPVHPWYDKLQVRYLIGPDAETMAGRLNVALPAAIITDDHYGILGTLVKPKNATEVARFLADPGKAGSQPPVTAINADVPKPLRDGVPDAWLVGGLHDGAAGVSIYGLDTESVLRPNPGQPYLSTQMMGGEMRVWQRAGTAANGVTVIEPAATHSYGWSRGSGYAHIYLHTDQPMQAVLHLRQSGIKTHGWLDGRPLMFAGDPHPPTDFPVPGDQAKTLLRGVNTEGLAVTAVPERAEAPQAAVVDLGAGWHSLLVKLVMQHDLGQSFFFAARFTDAAGHPLSSITTQLTDPAADLALNAVAANLRPLIYVDSPANLPRPGEPLRLRADVRWHPIIEERALSNPLPRFQGKLRLRLVDYRGKEIAVREIRGLFPGQAVADFGRTPEAGYYAVYPSLHTPEGKLIMAYPADGFTVVRGAAAQRKRLQQKKLWNNDYYALADGDKGFQTAGAYFDWLERMGIYRSYGSYPGFEAQHRRKWELARQRGIVLFGDTAGDSHWLNDKPEDGRALIATIAPFTRFFKASNEVDIRREREWQRLRDPAHWVQRAEWEYEQVHKLRPDGHYVGGSLVRPGDMEGNQDYEGGLGPGRWFTEVLKRGLDRFQDAWDVHAYPQYPPRFGGPIGNSPTEDERGVLAVYAGLGKKNVLPFWLGEAGAKAAHGLNGRRWQAEQAAKMIAWVNSRADYLGIAFCIGHEYDWGYGRLWDYSMGHKPGEAALYTAGALIDGLPYQAVDTQNADVQAAYFGDTFMIWRTDEAVTDWPLRRDPSAAWVVVDVVGHVEALPVDRDGNTTLRISASPVYVLSKPSYEQLTRN